MSIDKQKVFLKKVTTYDRLKIINALEESLRYFPDAVASIKHSDRVLLKPNLLQPALPQEAVTTHPELILAVIDVFRDFNIKVSIADSPAFGSARGCLKRMGILEELKKRQVKIFTFSKNTTYELEKPIHKHHAFSIAREIEEFDTIINLPKLKTHCQMQFTGATKNLYGCLGGKAKFIRHMTMKNNKNFFAQMLIANAEQVKPVLHIGDGITAMHRHGPRGGEPYNMGTIIVSNDFRAFDWTFCEMIGLKPEETYLFNNTQKPSFDIEGEPLEIFNDFVHAEQIDIAFHPLRMVRSVLKDKLIKLQGI